MATTDAATITLELPTAFDPRWSRLPGIHVDGRRLTIDPAEYFFRFESHTWLVADWELLKSQLLDAEETTESAVEQLALDFIKNHGESTTDAARVLATANEVYTYLFRDEHLAGLGLPQITADHLRMLREAAALMALNKVELDGHISNVGPCWFFPATTVVFHLDDETGGMLDEVYHGGWFNEHRRIESIKAHTALGGRLVHGCQSVPDQSGGVVAPYGASMANFRDDLAAFKEGWIEQVYAHRVTAAE
ncbi:hypothetical protein AQF52_8018 [Streptomyces venezuelae]|uniref:hypothetical protein n=1 Tax=Streptomyces gardneri TaxID=66892 RepID=UPI0006BDBDA7|nr:hypothetical protein [Streptomyces gardneri]ALO13599.1 hypothetical protein AQF52_8018 [Streptomyces venezuelae]QPK50191.1 hypothetical protein H4W23_40210 [Streptomyces gardneri]WRK41796.1 hypothetical protein U0M97_40455 [Streptomyces venezuelae]CUM35631.1 FIG01134333: hypothetical protein [Streptomyces venezuelae]